jgi:hypothetical protein
MPRSQISAISQLRLQRVVAVELLTGNKSLQMQEQMKVVKVTRRQARAEVGGGGGESTISHLNKATVGVFQQVKRFLAGKKFDSDDKFESVEKWLTSRAAEF